MKTQDTFFRFTFLIFCFCILSKNSFGQSANESDFFHKKRFNAGLVVGLNSSELAGKGLDSFFGWNAGVLGITSITKHSHFSLELLFSQNGEYLTPEAYPNLEFSKIRLNFIEVPFQYNFQLQQSEDINDRKGWLRAGLAFVHLLDYEVRVGEENVSEQIIWGKENAWLVNFGGTFFLNQHWGIDVRMSLPIDADDLIPTFAFRGIYLL